MIFFLGERVSERRLGWMGWLVCLRWKFLRSFVVSCVWMDEKFLVLMVGMFLLVRMSVVIWSEMISWILRWL